MRGLGDVVAKQDTGPGNVLKSLIALIGIPQTSSCGCSGMQQQMNQWGYIGCWQHKDDIVAWLVAKAKEHNMVVQSETVHGLLAAAAREWTKERLTINNLTT